MKQIDADLLKKHLDELCDGEGVFGQVEKAIIKAVKKVIDSEPSLPKKKVQVDGASFVRCKDCMYFTPTRDKFGSCSVNSFQMHASDYCSYGERND